MSFSFDDPSFFDRLTQAAKLLTLPRRFEVHTLDVALDYCLQPRSERRGSCPAQKVRIGHGTLVQNRVATRELETVLSVNLGIFLIDDHGFE